MFNNLKENDTFIFFSAMILLFSFAIIPFIMSGIVILMASSIVLYGFGFIETAPLLDILSTTSTILIYSLIVYIVLAYIDSRLLKYNLSKTVYEMQG